jgi:hypothetical protein
MEFTENSILFLKRPKTLCETPFYSGKLCGIKILRHRVELRFKEINKWVFLFLEEISKIKKHFILKSFKRSARLFGF